MNLWLQTNEELNDTNIYYFLTRDPPLKKKYQPFLYSENVHQKIIQ